MFASITTSNYSHHVYPDRIGKSNSHYQQHTTPLMYFPYILCHPFLCVLFFFTSFSFSVLLDTLLLSNLLTLEDPTALSCIFSLLSLLMSLVISFNHMDLYITHTATAHKILFLAHPSTPITIFVSLPM